MLIAGAGVGPIFAVFTIIVQNSVPFHELGAATSDLTLFRQIGTTIGPDARVHAVPQQPDLGPARTTRSSPRVRRPTPSRRRRRRASTSAQLTSVASVGPNPLAFVTQLPATTSSRSSPGFHDAFTIAIANSMLLGVAAAVVAVVAALFVREIPLRTTLGAQSATGRPVPPEPAMLG